MPITREQREKFALESANINGKIKTILDEIRDEDEKLRSCEDFEIPYIQFTICEKLLDVVELNLQIHDKHMSIIGLKHEASLDEARKKIAEIFIRLESITSSVIDLELSEIVKKQKLFPLYKDAQRLELVQRYFYLIERIEKGYGENSKWISSFVDIRGRGANIAKNLLDYIGLRSKNDPSEEGFNERRRLREIVEQSLIQSAKEYRERYEISGHNKEDMKKALDFLRALARMYIAENKREQLERMKKTIFIWNEKFKKDQAKQ
ncbi:MAG: hypothetical protein KBG82_09215 [Spirochaetes bacterium]|jgi:hypothetical protein|nr:hypothetical protein [Spirochaetota bacterium]NLJ04638.1 hypothetical protein [Exilispira sp.]HNV44441.1 hypothetical protein [Exilispira sp.]HPB47875.1 hypothetical protein [Exilispira sp.]HPO59961.1 hypothetical protein [Exilispira sp.]